MVRSGEISEDIKEKIISYHESGKSYKSISKIMGLHKSTIGSIICKWKTLGTVMNLPRSGRPPKISEDIKEKIISYHKSGKGYKSISKILGLHKSTIRSVICKWKTLGTVMNLPGSGQRLKISEDIKEKIISYHKSGKGYRSISKIMGLQKSTIGSIICKWKTLGTVMNLPRSGRPPKISTTAERKIIKEVTKKPEITLKELQACLALAKVKVSEVTIRRTLGKLGYVREYETVKRCRKE